jgi:hypothetical protein
MMAGFKGRLARSVPLAELYMGERDKDGNSKPPAVAPETEMENKVNEV